MEKCIFCDIASHTIPADILFEDDQLVVFHDIAPKAPYHILVVPKEHVPKVSDFTEKHSELIAHMILTATRVLSEAGHEDYKLVWNVGEGGGQSIFHAHLHVLAGKKMQEV